MQRHALRTEHPLKSWVLRSNPSELTINKSTTHKHSDGTEIPDPTLDQMPESLILHSSNGIFPVFIVV